MKKLFLLSLILITTHAAFCQNENKNAAIINYIDSLSHLLKLAKDDTSRVNYLNVISRGYCSKGDFDMAKTDVNEALALAQKINFKKGIANAYNNIGVINIEQANYPEALRNYLIALQMRQEINDKNGVSGSYLNIGNIYLEQGNYAEALKNYLAGLKIAEETNIKGIIAIANSSLANFYTVQGNYSEALKNDFISLKIWEESGDSHGILLAYLNIGNVYAQQGNYAEALKNYFIALQRAKKDGDTRSLSYSYGNIGDIYRLQGNYAEALKNHLTALKIEQQMAENYSIVGSYISLGKIYTKLNKQADANDYLSKGLALAKENGNKDQIKDAYEAFSELDSAEGNYNKAYHYFKLYSQFKDSLFNEKSNKQISQLKIQYETDKKDQQIKTQNLQINTQNLNLQNQALRNKVLQTKIYYGVAISLMVIGIIALLFYLFYLRNKKRKKEYEHTLTELELNLLKSQLNPHFISNSLNAIKSIMDLEPQKASTFLLKFARLMRRVLEQNEQPFITLKEELDTTELYMQIESLRLRYGFDYRFTIDPGVDPEMIMVPPLILQPTIENALWHGLSTKDEKGYIYIGINMENDLLKFTIEDNGRGEEPKAMMDNIQLPKKKSYGVSITRKRIEILSKELKQNGYYNLNFLKGRTITEIALPIE